MSNLQVEQEHQTSGVLIRGVLLVTAAGLARIEPETFFLDAMVGVGAIGLVFGLHEMNASRVQRAYVHAHWWLGLLNGATFASFGAATMLVLVMPFNAAVSVVVTWLTVYAVVQGVAASALRTRRVLSRVLVASGIMHAALAAVVLVMPAYPRLGMLLLAELGLWYVAYLGMWQIVIAVSMIRKLRGDDHEYVSDNRYAGDVHSPRERLSVP